MKSWSSAFLVAGLSLSLCCACSTSGLDEAILYPQFTEAIVMLAGAKTAVGEFYGIHKRCPVTNSETGFVEPTEAKGDFVASTTVGTRDGVCTVTARFGENAAPPLRGKFVGAKLKPDSSWECFTDIDPKYLPCKGVSQAAP